MTKERAAELVRLFYWQSMGCLMKGAVRPDIQDMTEQERVWLWERTRYNLFSTLCEIKNGRPVEIVAD